ncbi:MAG: tRNA dihydrouridine synthase DusB [Clostridia bacterium]|jgi:nifR3 family TIM-barrel protein|nr:tRNA dihydrouridine synthase DusB [Clostridia bacterium]
MKIGKVKLDNNIILAPMAGYTDVGFRTLCKKYGAGLTVTEMISAKGLFFNEAGAKPLLITSEIEKPVSVQIFGSEPEYMVKAIQHPWLQKFDIIDINMGCPVPKVYCNGEGSALMGNLPLAEKIISDCVKATKKPVTVKFRKGISEDSVNCVEFAKMCEGSGVTTITVHGRTRDQFYSGKADLSIIEKVVKAVKIPVIANGDLCTKEDYENVIKQTGCAGVMVGRGSLGRPWIFAKMLGKEYTYDNFELIKEHIGTAEKLMGEDFKLIELRKHFSWYLKGLRGVGEYREKLYSLTNADEILTLLKQALSKKD